MKTIVLFVSILFAAQASLASFRQVVSCEGTTHAGETFYVTATYLPNIFWDSMEAPYTVKRNNKWALLEVEMWEDGEMVYSNSTESNYFVMTVTEYSHSFFFAEREHYGPLFSGQQLQTAFLSIDMVAEQPSEIKFKFAGAWGEFENGSCAML